MLAVLKLLVESGVSLAGRLYWAVNNEGRSSHACSEAILARSTRSRRSASSRSARGSSSRWATAAGSTSTSTSRGKAAHSSTPQEGLSAIEGAHEVDRSAPQR